MTLKGSYPALVTPMDGDGGIDWECLRRLVGFHAEHGSDGLVIAGTTGESPTLTMAEHSELIARSLEYADGTGMPVVAGTGANSTAEAVELTSNAAKDGAKVCLSVVPYYNKPTQEGLYRHFSTIADRSDIDVILYNVPGRTITDLANETVLRLAEHPRIVGLKDATGDLGRLRGLADAVGGGFSLLSGDDKTCCDFMLEGGAGVISVTANIAPRAMRDLCEAATGGDADTAREIDGRLAAFHSAQGVEANPIPVKWAAWRMGLIPEGIRLPLTPLSEGFHAAVEEALERAECTLATECA